MDTVIAAPTFVDRIFAVGTDDGELDVVACVPIFLATRTGAVSAVGGASGGNSTEALPLIVRVSRGVVRGGAGGNITVMSFTGLVTERKEGKGGTGGTVAVGHVFRKALGHME